MRSKKNKNSIFSIINQAVENFCLLNTNLGVLIIKKKKNSFLFNKLVLHPGALFPTFWEVLFLEQAFHFDQGFKKKILSSLRLGSIR